MGAAPRCASVRLDPWNAVRCVGPAACWIAGLAGSPRARPLLVTVLKIVLGPWLLLQGRRVRRETPMLPEPEGPRSGGSGGFRLLVVGDSSGAGVGAGRFEETLTGRLIEGLGGPGAVTWTVIARTGWTTSNALMALADLEGPFDLAVTALGVNDVTADLPVETAASLHSRLLEELTGRLQARRVAVSTMPPIGRFPALPWPLRAYLGLRADRYDAALDAVAKRYGNVHRVRPAENMDASRMASDGFHPGEPVYREWSQRVLKVVGCGSG